MASPFKVFRKHQKLMLALLAVLAMFGFVILPAVLQGQGSGASANPVVATTSEYGDLMRSELSVLRQRRLLAIRFFEQLREFVYIRSRMALNPQGAEGLRQEAIRKSRELESVSWHILNERIRLWQFDDDAATSDAALVDTWLLAKRAEQLGMVVDDETINLYLEDLTFNHVSKAEIRQVLDAMRERSTDLFDALRQELLAGRLRSMFKSSVIGATPAQRWDYYQRVNRKVAVQTGGLAVDNYIGQVPKPDEATLKAFFDEHKALPFDPRSPVPGFREPRKVAVEYLKADYQKFYDKQLAAVTDEDIEQYYEKNKEDYVEEEFSLELPDSEGSPKAPPEPDADPEAGGATLEDNTPPKEPVGPKAAPPEGSDDTDAAAAEAKAPSTRPSEEGKEAPAAKPAGKETPEEADAGDSSAAERTSPFRLASFPAEEGEAPTTGVEPPAESPPAESPPTESPPAESPPAESPPPRTPPAKAAQAKAPQTPPAGPPGEAVEPEKSGEKEEPAAKQPRYLPLEKVKDQIRDDLARERTRSKIEQMLAELQNTQLNRYRQKLYQRDGEQTPPKPSFKKLAEERGMEFYQPAKPDFRSRLEFELGVDSDSGKPLEQADVGKSEIGRQLGFSGTPFPQYAFEAQELKLAEMAGIVSKSVVSQDGDGNYYLSWKVGEVEEKIPDFDDDRTKKRVEKAWKRMEARSIALKEGQRLTGLARRKTEPSVQEARKNDLEAARLKAEAEAVDPGDEKAQEQADRLAREAGDKADASWVKASDAFREACESYARDEGIQDLAVTGSEPFFWMAPTNRFSSQWLKISEVPGVVGPGQEFMRTVFGLKKGEISASINTPKTVVYVVQLTGSNPPLENLWKTFLGEPFSDYENAARLDQVDAGEAWLEGIKSEAGFAWDPQWKRSTGGG
ncbi:MAG: hypothetical protein ACYTG0_01720 [Planctomycetota bacterium]|jgi:hypothetical protein